MNTEDLKRELAQVIQHQGRLIDEFKGSKNPRNQEERRRLIESTNAFGAVLDRLNGGPSLTLYY